MGLKKQCSCGYWNYVQAECLYVGAGCIRDEQKKLSVDMAFLGTLRDRLMAIPIREYFVPNRRKVIMDELIKKFNEQGVEVVGVEEG